ncbi:glutamate-cysteine ligase family protein [Adlercreutzia faecimuris]|uniref:Glutamate--cysteine ligase n=1 Tax=Adlercreutzia faecimuris TaxID=2897341 RepID=A0ABS9WJD4_9ACTN|nr:glutamate-cysteine ligase family protein [Adlercreutzia sp. JBNU-10]MCI2242976.1 glutamate-cysteine ligase family protein [Adlercreutzia sp. JBNU-10]
MSKNDQPAREANIDAIVAYFESGAKASSERLGIELEHTLVRADGTPVPYRGPDGVQWLLGELLEDYPEASRDPEGDLLGVARPGEAVTIEPAAQVELSAGPFSRLADAEACFSAFEDALAARLDPVDTQVLTVGYHPTARAVDLELIPKRRYKLMNMYLGAISMFGICMMRGSASTQVSIDYSSAEDCLRKMRLAFALVPLLSLICDNSPVFEDAPRPHRLMRTEIWEKCDPDRCGVVPGIMEPGFTLRDYAAYVLDTPAILVACDAEQWCYTDRTFGEIYADEPMTREQVEHALSMFFTDVRLKTYVEIRPADAMPIPCVIAYAALIKGLFYDAGNLDALDRLFAGVTADDIAAGKASLMADGYDGYLYHHPVSELADEVMSLAAAGLSDEERPYLEPLASLVAARTTLADVAEEQRGE